MEVVLIIAVAVVVIYGYAKRIERRARRLTRPFRRTSPRRRLPPKVRTNHRQPPRQVIPKRSGEIADWTTPAGRFKANAGQRVTSGIEHDPPPPIPASRKIVGRAWVIDGDTIALQRIKIRLAGIDAPELDEPWGKKSKWAMVNLCKGQTIHVELKGETSYDRLVGTCYLPDGTDVGAEVVKAALALDGSYFSKGKYLHLEPEGARQRLGRYGLKQQWK